MFTGIIECQGQVISNHPNDIANRLVISSPIKDPQIGESIAVNGVCLTLVTAEDGNLHFDVSPETLRLTTLGLLSSNHQVNLERAMSATHRFGGHYVSGHVDGKAKVKSLKPLGEYIELVIHGFSAEEMLYLIPKGSVAIEGVSLTINSVQDDSISLMLIPHTLLHTTLHLLKIGQEVNIEFDYLTRIIAHQLKLMGHSTQEVRS
jgi:riboflavin synthase